MRAFRTLTKSEQVFAALRKTIKKNAANTELPLKGVRDLAREYNVSPRTVVIALNQLEEERLIRREHGRGTFICPAPISRGRDITMLLTYKPGQPLGAYSENFLRIAQTPYRRAGYNFTVRLVELARSRAFILELKRLLRPLHTDALLICAPSLDLEEIEACLHLELPVIFLGDFACDVPESLSYNQITGSNYHIGAESVKRLYQERPVRELILVSGVPDHFYYRDFTRGAVEKAAGLGIALHRIELPDQPFQDNLSATREILKNELSALGPDTDILTAVVFPDHIIRWVRDCGGPGRRIYSHRTLEQANIPLFKAVYDRLEELAGNRRDCRRIVLDLEFELTRQGS